MDRRRFLAGSIGAALAAGAGLPALGAEAADGPWGDLVGRFVYDGKAPQREKLPVTTDVECCGKYDIRDEGLMVGPDGGLANAYVYLISRKFAICPELEASVEKRIVLDNRDCIFIPHCMTVWTTKQEYHVVNSDPVGQTVALDPIGDTKVNQVLAVGGSFTHRFRLSQRYPVPIKCVYHTWESAYVLPRDNPYVAVSQADGTFRVPKLPVGELEFQVWHERQGVLKLPGWALGRFQRAIRPGTNDLGTIKVPPALVEKKKT